MDATSRTGAGGRRASRRRRFGRRRAGDSAAPVGRPATAEHAGIRHHLALANVRCVLDEGAGTLAAVAMLQLVFTNDGPADIEFRVESIRVVLQNRPVETDEARAGIVVAPGEAAAVRCPAIRGVDRNGSSAGNIDYVVVYGHPSAPPAARFRRQHGIWFRFEADDDGHAKLRFVERYDEDDPLQ